MAELRAQRRLAAILAADIVGYSRMMGADEAGTLALVRDVWALQFNPRVARFHGRIVKMMGDGALVEFSSAVDAVECALEFQGAMAEEAARREGRMAVQFRIGINLGDIVIEGDDIFGDGVNIAARLEPLAPRGGILVSDAVHAQIRGKVGATFTDAGALALKNITAPVQAWRWGEGASAAAPVPEPALPEGPSIAVLPFANMSGDAEQEYFSDGISEDIITDLSKISGLMVVARNSSFAYKGKTVDIRAVGRDLGVSSVLEGSIRRAGNRVRITAQLVDAQSGGHLWAERYDRDLTDIFAVQDEVTMQIVGALKVKLRPAERAALAEVRSINVEAHDQLLQGREVLFGAIKDAPRFHRALACFERAIEIDPDYSAPYAALALAHTLDFLNAWTDTPDKLLLAERLCAQALGKNPNDPYSHYVSGVVKMWQKDMEGASAAFARALELSPSHALAQGALGAQMIYMGEPEAALEHLRRAMVLEPGFGHQALQFRGMAEFMLTRYATAEATFRERIAQSPNTDVSRAYLAATLGHLGRPEEARAVWADLGRVNPRYSLHDHMERSPFRRAQDRDRILEGLALAGLPN